MTRRTATCAALLIAWAVGGASCISPVETTATRTTREAIIGGDADTTDTAIVAIVQTGGTLCTGALVAPSLVLTAGHCVNGIAASSLKVVVGTDSSNPDQTVAVTSAFTYPTYDSAEDSVPGGVDLGFVTLATPLGMTPLSFASDVSDATLAGGSVTVVGYGQSSGAEVVGAGVRREVSLAVTGVCSRVLHAGDAATNVCEGDSGGPVLVGGRIVAVVSGGQPGCTSPADLTRTDAHSVWIASVIAAGGAPASCAKCVEPDPSCTATTETAAAGATGDAGDDAGTGGAMTGPAKGKASTGGCAVAPQEAGTWGSLATLAGVLLLLSRSRRSCYSPPP